MTYIAAFRCATGIVMCADTLETIGDTKNYVEKLEIPEDKSFPIAIGGAGVDDIIQPFTQEVMDRVAASPPATKEDLKIIVKGAINEVFTNDLPFLVIKKQHRTPQFLIGAKCKDGEFCILSVIGKRLYKEQSRGIIGYPTAYNVALMKRYQTDSMSMSRAVLLATFLVAQSKQHDDGVGGETRIVVITQTGAWLERPEFVKDDEKRFTEFRDVVDRLLLASPDLSVTEVQFDKSLDSFRVDVRKMRDSYKRDLFHRQLMATHEPGYKGEPYTNIPLGGGIGYDTMEDMESGNKAAMKILEPDWYESKKKLMGPVLWFVIRQEISKLANLVSTEDDWVIALEIEDWNVKVYRFNDASQQTVLTCDQGGFDIECRGPSLSVDYKLTVQLVGDASSHEVAYRDGAVVQSPAEIAKRAVESIKRLDSQTSADQQ